jgi:hypothetical protein
MEGRIGGKTVLHGRLSHMKDRAAWQIELLDTGIRKMMNGR